MGAGERIKAALASLAKAPKDTVDSIRDSLKQTGKYVSSYDALDKRNNVLTELEALLNSEEKDTIEKVQWCDKIVLVVADAWFRSGNSQAAGLILDGWHEIVGGWNNCSMVIENENDFDDEKKKEVLKFVANSEIFPWFRKVLSRSWRDEDVLGKIIIVLEGTAPQPRFPQLPTKPVSDNEQKTEEPIKPVA